MAPHKAVIRTQIGKTLPLIAGHFAQHRAFAMHDLIMRDRQHIIFAKGIHQAKAHAVVMPAPMHRLFGDIAQRVIHPPHIPLVVKAQATGISRR